MAQTNLVTSGTTSVSLDLPLLELALGVTLVSVDTSGEAFSEEFQLGFPIVADTDFSFETEPFTPLDGTINHSGTVTLNLNDAPITVGDFSIGFDASRISNIASGFFVSDNTEDVLDLEILFDISAPGNVTTDEGLTISEADLLVAPELADALGSSSFTGADVGDTRIDASAVSINEDIISINGDIRDNNLIDLYRFRNNVLGTYLFVGEEEGNAILGNSDLNQVFILEGINEDRTLNSAFIASAQPRDDLLPFYRFQSLVTPGTYVFVGEEERNGIVEEFSNSFIEEGLAFYVYGVGSNLGIPFNRFQNTQNNAFLYTGPEETAAINSDPNLSSIFEDQGVAFEGLI